MKKILCLAAMLSTFSVFGENDGSEPTIYADISEFAQENAVSFDGVRGFIGLIYQTMKYQACTGNNALRTENTVNSFGLTAGIEYAIAFRKGFVVSVDIGADINKKGKHEGSWINLNEAYNSDVAALFPNADLKRGKLETESIAPNIAVKIGYPIQSAELLAFLKAGMSKLGGTYHYTYGGANICKVDVSKFIPIIGLGIEHKINSKWGIVLDVGMSLKRNIDKSLGGVTHKIKIGRSDIRIMGTYRMAPSR